MKKVTSHPEDAYKILDEKEIHLSVCADMLHGPAGNYKPSSKGQAINALWK